MRTVPRAHTRPLVLACALVACLGVLPGGAQAASARVVRDLAVPDTAGAPVTLDVWRRAGARTARPRPIAVLVHGGGWHSGDKRQWEQVRWTQRLASRGWLVVNANYRLACARTATSSPLCGNAMRASVHDVRSTVRYVASRARVWGGDPERIVLFGASAGAQLAMLAGSDPRRPAGVRAVVAVSPPIDLEWIGATPDLVIHGSAALSIGCPLAACPQAWRAASPLAQVERGLTPPTWLFAAGSDSITPLGSAQGYVDRLREAGSAGTLVTTADPASTCHGPRPCAGVALAGTHLDLLDAAQAWMHPLT